MTATMRAHVIHAHGQRPRLQAVAIPTPGPGEVLIRVTACGVCHSDIHAVDGDWAPPSIVPLIPGHEVTGHVVAHGPGVAAPAIGTAVGVAWLAGACGHCEFCLNGMETICLAAEATGYTRDGGYAEYVTARADFLATIPDGADLVRLAPVLCAGVTTYRGLKHAHARPGQFVGIVGVGGLGHIAIQYAKAMGFRPVAVDVDPAKLELARRVGAEFAFHAVEDGTTAVLEATGGGCHAVLVTATAPRAFEQAVDMTRAAGTTVFIGIPPTANDLVRLSIIGLVNGEKVIRGSNVGTRLDLQEAVDFAARNLVVPEIETVAFENAALALDRLRGGAVAGRLVLTF
ncbi:MAG: zinc-dependent alcohol dehydrogenase [Acidocella sp.]|nr:zinc-dependent alcohol dehydrogenase [Acidocella sp.]